MFNDSIARITNTHRNRSFDPIHRHAFPQSPKSLLLHDNPKCLHVTLSTRVHPRDRTVLSRLRRVNLALHSSPYNVERIRAGLSNDGRDGSAEHALQGRSAASVVDVILEKLARGVHHHPRNPRVGKNTNQGRIDARIKGQNALSFSRHRADTSLRTMLDIATPMLR